MEERLCEYCDKRLPKELRADARFCPGSRCRVAAMRKGKKLREASLLGPTRQDEGSFIAALQRKRKSVGEPPLIRDRWCQLQAEILACDILADYYREKKWKLREQLFGVHSPWSVEEKFLQKGKSFQIAKSVTRIGLVSLPADCEVSAVVVTGRR